MNYELPAIIFLLIVGYYGFKYLDKFEVVTQRGI